MTLKMVADEEGHEYFAASASSRWLSCTASALIDTTGLKKEQSASGSRGTMLHGLAEKALNTGKDPAGPKLSPPDVESVMEYVNLVREREGTKFIEVKTTFVDGCGGTSDSVVIEDGVLEVIDYKSGIGYVDPVENTQLIIYALGVVQKFGTVFDFDKVKLTIVQPAIENVNSWVISLKDLERWGREISETVERIKAGDVEYVPTESNCRWCPGRSICPALEGKAQEVAKADFKNVNDLTWEEKLALVPLVEAWCKGVTQQTSAMLLGGEKIDGWKVVEGRRGNRAWRDETKTISFLRKTWRLTAKQIMKPGVLLSPSAIEQLTKKDDLRPKADMAKLIAPGAKGNPTAVPDSDARKELKSADMAKRDFENLPEDE